MTEFAAFFLISFSVGCCLGWLMDRLGWLSSRI